MSSPTLIISTTITISYFLVDFGINLIVISLSPLAGIVSVAGSISNSLYVNYLSPGIRNLNVNGTSEVLNNFIFL